MPNDAIHIACVTDENYIPHCAALLKSIEQNNINDDLIIHIINDSVPEYLLNIIRNNCPKLKIISYSINDHPALTLPPLLQISRATYLRLIMDEILDQTIERLIYLDIDMIVTGGLRELWELSLGDHHCAAVIDPGVASDAFARKYGLGGIGEYFNAGMIVLDMRKARENQTLNKALSKLLKDRDNFQYADQDALNIVLWQKWLKIDATWNFQRKFLYSDYSYESFSSHTNQVPRIIHFTESAKPWLSNEWHPFAWLYWKYLLATPFARAIKEREHIGAIRLLKFWLKYQFGRRQII